MIAINKSPEKACYGLIQTFFKKYRNRTLEDASYRMLKNLINGKIPMAGKPGGWAGGIIYALANQYQSACGIPGILNSEVEEFFSTSMSTIYKRAERIGRLMDC